MDDCEECYLHGVRREADTVRPHPNNAMPMALCTSCAINYDRAEQRIRKRHETTGDTSNG